MSNFGKKYGGLCVMLLLHLCAYAQYTLPTLPFQSTSSMSATQSPYQSVIVSGNPYTTATLGTPSERSLVASQRKRLLGELDVFEDENDPNLPDGPQTQGSLPLGDGTGVFIVLSLIYVFYIRWKQRKQQCL